MPAFTIYLIQVDKTQHDEIIIAVEDHDRVVIRRGRSVLGMLFVGNSPPGDPSWLKHFRGSHEHIDLGLKNKSTAAVLLVTRGTRRFAVVFGYCRFMLQDDVIEPRFGLRVALNSVEPRQLRSIDSNRLDAVPRLTREQRSKGADLSNFGLNIERDMLRALSGTPTDPTFGAVIAGGDQLVVRGPTELGDLPPLLDRYLHQSTKATYRREFAWVDNIQPVGDRLLSGRLDHELIRLISEQGTAAFSLAAPEILNTANIGGFRYRGGRDAVTHDDLDLALYFSEQRPANDVTIEHLR